MVGIGVLNNGTAIDFPHPSLAIIPASGGISLGNVQ